MGHARATRNVIHRYLLRAAPDRAATVGPLFVAINRAGIPHELIESELLGYKDGAFSGARRGGQVGKVELADRGHAFP